MCLYPRRALLQKQAPPLHVTDAVAAAIRLFEAAEIAEHELLCISTAIARGAPAAPLAWNRYLEGRLTAEDYARAAARSLRRGTSRPLITSSELPVTERGGLCGRLL